MFHWSFLLTIILYITLFIVVIEPQFPPRAKASNIQKACIYVIYFISLVILLPILSYTLSGPFYKMVFPYSTFAACFLAILIISISLIVFLIPNPSDSLKTFLGIFFLIALPILSYFISAHLYEIFLKSC